MPRRLLWLFILGNPITSHAESFAARISCSAPAQHDRAYWLNSRIQYTLSPTAKEALDKGVPLAWVVSVRVQQTGRWWPVTLSEQQRRYSLQFHALLNQYSVKRSDAESAETFLSLNAALDFMSVVPDIKLIDREALHNGEHYQIAIKARFDREALPSPLRPTAYLNSDWFLSSDWILCPLPNSNSR